MLHSETIRRMKEENSNEKRRNAVQMKRLEEAVAILKDKSVELKKEQEEKTHHNEMKDIVNALICKSVHESINKDLAEFLKNNTCLEDELILMKTQIIDKESKLDEIVRLQEV